MKKARFMESHVMAILKEADAGISVGDVIRTHRISLASYYKCKTKYSGLDNSGLKRIKELEAQLSEFKQIEADLTLERKAMKGLSIGRFFRRTRKHETVGCPGGQMRGSPPLRTCCCAGLSRAAYSRKRANQSKRGRR
jgi:putative transposase